jgi:hypothetical protein
MKVPSCSDSHKIEKGGLFLLPLLFFVSKVHDDRIFQALSESVIICPKSYSYTNNKVETWY